MLKSQLEVIDDLQSNPDYIILNNLFAIPNFVGIGKRGIERNEVYTPKIFFEIVSQLTPKHLECIGDYVSVDFSVGNFLESIASTQSNNDYNHVISCIKKMQQISIEFENEDVIAGFSVIPHYKYEKGDKKMTLQIRKELARAVLTVKKSENFSFLKKYLFKLNNAQAIKFFPFFISWRHKGMVEMDLDVFKEKFDCATEGYKKFNNLKLRVLDPALKEINDKTDLFITYKVLGKNLDGTRQRVTGLQFFIKENKQQKQLTEKVDHEITDFEEIETTKLTPPNASNASNASKTTKMVAKNPYLSEILRIFLIFEPETTAENISYFLSAFDDKKALLEACLFAEEEHAKKHEIKNFRGYLISGVPKGLGAGLLEKKEKAQAKQQNVQQKKNAQAEKAAQLELLLQQAEILRGTYKKDINDIMRKTATDADKEHVADIMRAKSVLFAAKTLDDFRSERYISTYMTTFIETYPDRFEDVQNRYQQEFNALTAAIKPLDPTKKSKNLFYY
jgi:hypothetical protein